MKKITEFWQRYVAGEFTSLCEFKKAVAKERISEEPNDTFVDRFTDQYKDAPLWEAPKRIANASFMSSEQMLKLHDRADWQQTDDAIKLFAARYIEAARKQGIPLYVHSAYRTKAEQNALVRDGRSQTKYPAAAHCQGAAVDVVHGRYHWMLTNGEWAYLGRLGKDIARRSGIAVTWGGDWSFYDPAHWEINGWREDIHERTEGAPVRYTPRHLLRVIR